MALRKTNADVVQRVPTVNQIRRAVDARETSDSALIDGRGTTLSNALIYTDDPEIIVREVSALWATAQRTFLTIGQYLVAAKNKIESDVRTSGDRLTETERRAAALGQYRRLILQRLPFGDKVAHQLETVARAVFETRRIGVDEMPSSYSIAYQLTTLDDEELAAAKAEGLVSNTVKREQLLEFKRLRRSTTIARHTELKARRARILAAIKKLESELASVDEQLRIIPLGE